MVLTKPVKKHSSYSRERRTEKGFIQIFYQSESINSMLKNSYFALKIMSKNMQACYLEIKHIQKFRLHDFQSQKLYFFNISISVIIGYRP